MGGGNGQVLEEEENGNKEDAGSDPRGIPAEQQQEWCGGWLLVMHCKKKWSLKGCTWFCFHFLGIISSLIYK